MYVLYNLRGQFFPFQFFIFLLNIFLFYFPYHEVIGKLLIEQDIPSCNAADIPL